MIFSEPVLNFAKWKSCHKHVLHIMNKPKLETIDDGAFKICGSVAKNRTGVIRKRCSCNSPTFMAEVLAENGDKSHINHHRIVDAWTWLSKFAGKTTEQVVPFPHAGAHTSPLSWAPQASWHLQWTGEWHYNFFLVAGLVLKLRLGNDHWHDSPEPLKA